MERMPQTEELLHEPDLLAIYADTEAHFAGQSRPLQDLAKMCPVDLSDERITVQAKNEFVAKIINTNSIAVAPEHETVFNRYVEKSGQERQFTVRQEKPHDSANKQPLSPIKETAISASITAVSATHDKIQMVDPKPPQHDRIPDPLIDRELVVTLNELHTTQSETVSPQQTPALVEHPKTEIETDNPHPQQEVETPITLRQSASSSDIVRLPIVRENSTTAVEPTDNTPKPTPLRVVFSTPQESTDKPLCTETSDTHANGDAPLEMSIQAHDDQYEITMQPEERPWNAPQLERITDEPDQLPTLVETLPDETEPNIEVIVSEIVASLTSQTGEAEDVADQYSERTEHEAPLERQVTIVTELAAIRQAVVEQKVELSVQIIERVEALYEELLEQVDVALDEEVLRVLVVKTLDISNPNQDILKMFALYTSSYEPELRSDPKITLSSRWDGAVARLGSSALQLYKTAIAQAA